eukprot:3263632-Rhodomonas_salina.3
MAPVVPNATQPLTVTICGGGNSTHVMAALLGSKPNVTVNIFDVMEEEVAKFNAAFAETDRTITVKSVAAPVPFRCRLAGRHSLIACMLT